MLFASGLLRSLARQGESRERCWMEDEGEPTRLEAGAKGEVGGVKEKLKVNAGGSTDSIKWTGTGLR